MCNANVIAWFDQHLTGHDVFGADVLDVGGRDVNGSVRQTILANGAETYTGVDVQPGPGVDVICDAARLVERFGENRFDLVVSTCALEHIQDALAAISQMKRVCAPVGLICLAVPSEWPWHGYPSDYWRFNPEDLNGLFRDCRNLIVQEQAQSRGRRLVFAKYLKPEDFHENPDLVIVKKYALRREA